MSFADANEARSFVDTESHFLSVFDDLVNQPYFPLVASPASPAASSAGFSAVRPRRAGCGVESSLQVRGGGPAAPCPPAVA